MPWHIQRMAAAGILPGGASSWSACRQEPEGAGEHGQAQGGAGVPGAARTPREVEQEPQTWGDAAAVKLVAVAQ